MWTRPKYQTSHGFPCFCFKFVHPLRFSKQTRVVVKINVWYYNIKEKIFS